MKEEYQGQKGKAGTLIFWQILSFACAFFACSFLTGLETVFCALAAALSAGLVLVQPSLLSLLGSLAGGLLGYAFALWNTDGGVLKQTLTAAFLPESAELSLDLRIFGAVNLVLVLLSCLTAVLFVRKGYARTACVGAVSLLFLLAQGGCLAVFFYQKYSVLSLELLREKLALLVERTEAFLEFTLQSAGELPEKYADQILSAARGTVYSLPAMGIGLCLVCAFLLSFVLKRLMRRSGVLGEENSWSFTPSFVSAAVYITVSVAAFFMNAFDPYNPALYGFELLDTVFTCLFFVPGLTAIRLLWGRRRNGGGGYGAIGILALVMLFPLVFPLLFSVLPIVGLAFTVSTEIRRRIAEKQNKK